VEWQLFDVATEQVVYKQEVEGAWSGYGDQAFEGAVQGALEGLLTYPAFPAQLADAREEQREFAPFNIKACPKSTLSLPEELDQAKGSVLLVKTPDGIGSGVNISPDGFVLTAAHVVQGHQKVSLKTSAGVQLDATVVRIDTAQDVALLSMPGTGYNCIAPREAPPAVGEELWAIGNPLGEELSFSVTKGLVSGMREMEGQSYLQTDAPLNPGYSGGPLLDQHGQLLALISWKVSGASFEGLGFGVPVKAAKSSLNLVFAETSSAVWGGVEDKPISSGGEEVRRFTQDQDTPERPATTPSSSVTYIEDLDLDLRVDEPKLGLRAATLTLGALTVGGTAAWYYSTEETDPSTWMGMTALNSAGWVVTAIGAALVLRARPRDSEHEPAVDGEKDKTAEEEAPAEDGERP
jgi:S1-C subfamily serine protease